MKRLLLAALFLFPVSANVLAGAGTGAAVVEEQCEHEVALVAPVEAPRLHGFAEPVPSSSLYLPDPDLPVVLPPPDGR